ncbi:hypothetical protein FBUS_05837 [Fasciolopsis buskii]|uniref:Peptidase A1 domain-containing protein n=1 Tax=Fasciolopsis buskii TaxID=27845 RepID=A0A8E0S2N5_9TREM|nr:hypothetical protein FBUS_05837 [Fasciolopsis buski]
MDSLVKHEKLANVFTLVLCGVTQLNFDKSIVDSGTTNIHLPLNIYAYLVSHIMQIVVIRAESHHWENLQDMDIFWQGKSTLCVESEGDTPGGPDGTPYILFPSIEFQMVSTKSTENGVISVTLSPQVS